MMQAFGVGHLLAVVDTFALVGIFVCVLLLVAKK